MALNGPVGHPGGTGGSTTQSAGGKGHTGGGGKLELSATGGGWFGLMVAMIHSEVAYLATSA